MDLFLEINTGTAFAFIMRIIMQTLNCCDAKAALADCVRTSYDITI